MHCHSLLLDIGNSSIKCRELTRTAREDSGMDIVRWRPLMTFADVDALLAYLGEKKARFNSVLIGSVRSDSDDTAILKRLTPYATTIELAQTQSAALGLTNSYANPQKMGVDRWLAMLGAQLLCGQNFLVIDAGTAVTADFVVNGLHQGGWIAPGFSLAQEAVTGHTARVTQAPSHQHTIAFGQNTEDCLHFGCLAQLHGIVHQAKLLAAQFGEFDVILSGGDVDRLRSLNQAARNEFIFVDNIVLFGILRMALADMSLDNAQKVARSLLI
ncbi:type III pantothenate kinase [Alteromonas oceanisediminis]|uniref:type III pantothenate kinase n=1 Tax=Alteromonas oceanisediminis TaxID=2836180 RepID=UPI001BDAFEC6|nr:type III pantothenate kinase [Alteromonas oceanisediminis]MBT0587790.1 type III pantothenate kinase [Alteromonas oceanisediminis]